MRVQRDFDLIYATEGDPWSIGDADSDRYQLYVELITTAAQRRGSILDIGCGFGALLARFEGVFDELHGIEVSAEAVRRGSARFPALRLEQGSATALQETSAHARRFDAIVYSDVISYFSDRDKRASVRWIAEHLAPGGLAFIAAWSPGGDYLQPAELRAIVDEHLVIEHERVLDSDHALFLARPRRRMVALTLDYETWQPVPAGRRINWDADVLQPTARLLDACEREQARLTIMAELGELLFLREHEPEVAVSIEDQLCDAVRRGHDVQAHLHPAWLPELGARPRPGGGYDWDLERSRADDVPDLHAAIGRCRDTLLEILRPVDPTYEVVAFRAGAYEAQPFRRLAAALREHGIWCDTSVYRGGPRPDRHFDYSLAYSDHQPYFASAADPQLRAVPAEAGIVELPIATLRFGERWTFDGPEGETFAARLLDHVEERARRRPSTEALRRRKRAATLLGSAYDVSCDHRTLVNRLLPRRAAHLMTSYPPEPLAQHEYRVAIGHSKADLQPDAIAGQLRLLREAGYEVVRLRDMALSAREELKGTVSGDAREEAERQVAREAPVVLSDERNDAQSVPLQRLVPSDRTRILDLGCGRGDWSSRLADQHPLAHVVGVDIGEEFIAAARERNGSERVTFAVEDFAALSFPDATFDCIYADNALEHAFDIDRTLAEAHRVLTDGGILVAAIPPDARDPDRVCDDHTWKTWEGDVRERLRHAGFVDVVVRERDVYRELGAAPYPPSQDRMLYVAAWRRAAPAAPEQRVDELTAWTRRTLDPSRPSTSFDPVEIVAGGYAWCAGMTLVLGDALDREGFDVRWVTMLAADHPRGRGPERWDSHEVLEVTLPDGREHVVDAMAGVRFPAPVRALLADPALADVERDRDARYRERGYDLYATSFWYRRVRRLAVRETLTGPQHMVPVRWAPHARSPLAQGAAALRARGWVLRRALSGGRSR